MLNNTDPPPDVRHELAVLAAMVLALDNDLADYAAQGRVIARQLDALRIRLERLTELYADPR